MHSIEINHNVDVQCKGEGKGKGWVPLARDEYVDPLCAGLKEVDSVVEGFTSSLQRCFELSPRCHVITLLKIISL